MGCFRIWSGETSFGPGKDNRRSACEMPGYIGDPAVPTLVFGDMNAAPDAPDTPASAHRPVVAELVLEPR
jgi:hypothetical protein